MSTLENTVFFILRVIYLNAGRDNCYTSKIFEAIKSLLGIHRF